MSEESSSAKATDDKKNDEKKEETATPVEKVKAEDTKVASEEKAVEIPEKFKAFVEQIEQMSVLEMSGLVKVLEEKFGVSAAAPVTAVATAPGGDEAGAAEEKSSFNIELTETGENKINVIKAIRAVTEKGLKEAKDMVDSAPQIVKEGVDKEEAENIKKQLEEAGAKVTLK